jgi:carboxyl-terminal processing protease
MKNLAISFILLLNTVCFGQQNVKATLDSVIRKAKETSLYSSSTDWKNLQNLIYQKAENAKTIQELKPAFETLLNGLRDHHGKIINAADYSPIAHFTDQKNQRFIDNRERDIETWKVMNDISIKFSYKILEGKIGYLKIVGIAPNVDIEKESKAIRKAIIKLSKKRIDQWVIDLRYNTGGNMNPMMAGIGSLVGDGIVGKLVNLKGDVLDTWEIKKGNFIYLGSEVVNLPNKPKFKKNPKIAVLTSRWTTSSGEIVATTLKGRPNTKFFGEATGGFTTNNNWETISNQLILSISSGIYCDRNGTIYEKNIPVDVEIPFEIVADTEKDKCVIEAKKWLKDNFGAK